MVVVEGLWCQFDVSRPWLNRIFNRAGSVDSHSRR